MIATRKVSFFECDWGILFFSSFSCQFLGIGLSAWFSFSFLMLIMGVTKRVGWKGSTVLN
jgi:hypothetical protein